MTSMWGAPIHKRWRVSRLRDPRQARFLTVASVLVAGACGGLIGWAVADLQCSGDCTVQTGIGGLIGAELGSRRLAPVTMRRLLSVVLIVAGVKMLLGG